MDVYIDDGYSSKNLKRPAIQQMMKDAASRKFDVLVFWRLNRLTRNVRDKENLFELFDRNNVGIKSMSEELDTTTASGRMVTNVLVSVAQGEREQTAENVHATMMDMHLKGKRNGAPTPYGYSLVEGALVVNDYAEVVRRIFAMYQQNMGALAIAKQLNRERAPGKLQWNYFVVMYIIMNPVYCGRMRWNYRKGNGKRTGKEVTVDGQHEAIIDEEEFDRVQKLRERRGREGKKATSTYPYTGVLRCGRCNKTMIGGSRKVKDGKKRFYKCVGRFNYGTCNMPIIAEEAVNLAFLEALELLDFEKDYKVSDDKPEDLNQYQKELDGIRKRKKKWQEAFANEVISLDDLRERTTEDRQREQFILSQLDAEPKKEKSAWTREEILEQLRQVKTLWNKITDDVAKKNFLYEIFEHFSIDLENEQAGYPGYLPLVKIVDFELKS